MKKFFGKIKNWFIAHKPSKRRLIQLYTALLYNANIKGFFTGKISTSASKNVCVPGFNCYSCPGAVGSCPLGSLQNALGASKTSTIAYVFGIIVLFGLILGRTICGFLCPMGLAQDLLYKIKSPKLKKSKITKILSYLKYVLLVVFVILIPLMYSDTIVLPAFCQYICPTGLLAGLTFLGNPANAGELASLGVLFTWKFCLAVLIIIGAIFVYRLFCRFLCPLGALYGLFSRLALLGIKLDKDKCIDCGLCIKTCQVDITRVGDHECIQCGLCVSVCPTQAISWKGGKFFVLPNQIGSADVEGVDLVSLAKQNHEPYENANTNVDACASDEIKQQEPQVKPQKVKKVPLYNLRKNNGKGFKIIALTLALVILATALVYYNFIHEEPVASSNYAVGDTMEDFETRKFFTTDGRYKLSNDRGKIVVINFWYIGCGGCELEMPHFGKLANDINYNDKVSIVVLHSSEDVHEPEKLVNYNGNEVFEIERYILEDKSQGAIEENRWVNFYQNITWAMDLGGEEALYLALGGRGSWPITAILDEEGVIRYITLSSVSEQSLYAEVDKLLAD